MSDKSTILTVEAASKYFPATEFQNLIRNLKEKSVQRRTSPKADCTRFLKWFLTYNHIQCLTVDLLTSVCLTIKKKEIHQLNCLNNVRAFRHESKKGICEIFDTRFWELFIFENISVFVNFASFCLL